MNRLRKWTAILLGAAMVLVGGARPALAAGSNVEYVGGAAGFVVLPDSNLFDGMNNLMPGDVRTESIAVGNRSTVACDLYLTTRGSALFGPLMDQLTLCVALVSAQGQETELYNGTAAGAGNAIHLGRYSPGTGATLNATISVPVTMGNEYEHAIDSVSWVFAATEYRPPSPSDDDDDDDDSSTVITKTPIIVKMGSAGLLPATGSQSKL